MFNKNLIKDSFLYIVSDAIFGGLPIILLPIFSYYLLPEDFGLYTNIIVLMNLFSIFIDYSASGYYGVNFYLKSRKISRDEVFMNSIRLMLINTILLFVFVLIFIDTISENLKLNQIDIYNCLFFGLLLSINTLYLTKLRFLNKVISFVKYRLFQVFIHTLSSLAFVIILDLSWQGRYFGHFLPILLIFPVIIYNERRHLSKIKFFSSSYKYLTPAFIFGITLLPHVLSSWIKTGFDRFILTSTENIAANGIYSTAFQFSIIITLVGVGFNKAFSPYLFKKLNGEYKSVKILLYKFFIANLIFVIFVLLILPIFVKFFLSKEYIDVIPILPYVILAQGCLNIYIILSNILFHLKKTLTLSLISVFSAFCHVIFLFLFIDKFLEFGAAISFLFSAIIQTLLTFLFIIYNTNYLWK